MHALVGYGSHGKHEKIQDLMCQACGLKFTVRRDTVLYRLKTHSRKVAQALALMVEGVDVSVLERVMRIGGGTLRTWLTQAGMHAERLLITIFQELIFGYIMPIFTSDGLMLYLYALTTHFGHWAQGEQFQVK